MVPEISHIENIIKIIKDYVGYDIPVLYGGSVSNSNINTLKNMKNIDGFSRNSCYRPKQFHCNV